MNSTGSDWIPPFQLDSLKLAHCNLGHRFPKWIQTQTSISHLDLSYAGISDAVPKWLWDLSPRLEYLNLSHNYINGEIPDLSLSFVGFPKIDLSSNNFSGPLPLFHPNTTALQLSENMFVGSISSICTVTYDKLGLLDLSNNQFSGELPYCWMNMKNLYILIVADNNFSGEIPESLGSSSLCLLLTLHLRNNNFSGELPFTLKNCQGLRMIDVGGNQLTGNIPTWIGTYLTNLVVISFRHNKFHGRIPPEMCLLTKLQILDLSNNNISARIPSCFDIITSMVQVKEITESSISSISFTLADGSRYEIGVYIDNALVGMKGMEFKFGASHKFLKLIDLSSNRLVGNIPGEVCRLNGLLSLNLSRNLLTGNINSDIGQLARLESLDLSGNHLSGEIPIGLRQLTYLSFLDLSDNNLSGKIPVGNQFDTFDQSTYAGNGELCGRPLTTSCPGEGQVPSISNYRVQNVLDVGFYIPMVFGFLLGFW